MNSELPTPQERMLLKSDGRMVFVATRSISHVQGEGNYVAVTVGKFGERHLVRSTLTSFEERLDPSIFVRIHRSVIVNKMRIKEMRPCYTGEYLVTMDTGTVLTLSRGYRFNLNRLLEADGAPPAPQAGQREARVSA